MPKTLHTNIGSLLQEWICNYYEQLREQPTIRRSHEEHLQSINLLNKAYLKDLDKHEVQEAFEMQEHYKSLFKIQIDFLTGVYTKEEENNARNRQRDKLKNIPNRHYTPNA